MSFYRFGNGKYNFSSFSQINLEPIWWYCIFSLSFLVSLWGMRKIWQSRDYLFFKILYSIIIFIPIFGPPIVLWIMYFFLPHNKK